MAFSDQGTPEVVLRKGGSKGLMKPSHEGNRLAGIPEAWFGIFGFLLHFPWEFLQVPFFEHMPELRHWEAVKTCTQAAAGDAVITLVAFWAAAGAARSREWYWRPGGIGWSAYLGAGLVVTGALEWLSTEVLDRWQYAAQMPTLPVLGTGLAPVVQWLLLPPVVLWLARGQLRGARCPRIEPECVNGEERS